MSSRVPAMDDRRQPRTPHAGPLSGRAQLLKSIEDRMLAVLILLITSPVLLVVALAVKCTSPGPVLFVQDRLGLHGHIIRIFKFRTMYHRMSERLPRTTATAVVTALQAAPSTDDPDDVVQATVNDPRITPLGRFLRRTSIDELPQFFNVLRGDMSIVGPRPHALKHCRQFLAELDGSLRRDSVKPGITGLAQISGARGEIRTVDDVRRRVALDLQYIRTWSLWLDLKIIVLTILRGWYNRQP